MPDELLSLAGIGRMLGVTRSRAEQLARQYDDFPQPAAQLTGGARGWRTKDVEKWMARHPERKPGRPKREKKR